MFLKISIPDYDGEGIDVIWEENAYYSIDVINSSVCLKANSEGLVSIAKQLLYFAYSDLPTGSHVHLDSFFTNTASSFELVVEKND